MKMFMDCNGSMSPVSQMSYIQSRQAIAVMDCIGRLIPQEGVDYDIVLTFKGKNDSNISIGIEARTDKGTWWMDYVTKMIKKYPPKIENPEMSIEEDDIEIDKGDEK